MSARHIACWIFLCLVPIHAKALTPVTLCIWDPVGNQGPVFSFFFDLKVKALNWGVDMSLQAYESELEILERLEQGTCDASLVTAILARDYVHFGGSLDAIGALRNETQLRLLLAAINSPKLRPALQQGQYEIAAILPVGPMYAFVNDRRISDLRAFENKRISALNSDVQTRKLAEVSRARALNTTISDFAEKFKRQAVDIVLMPALAYTAFELEQGMRKSGGVIDIRFFNTMLQAIVNRDKVDDQFAVNFRNYMAGRTKAIFKLIETAEAEIPEHYWIKTDPKLQEELEALFKDIRLELMFEEKLDERALKLLWRIRCKTSKDHPECMA